MGPKTRSSAGKGGRGGSKKAAKIVRPTRNITRWSANKDIALLCALTKECRRDKFQPSWERVAKWIGPNITGAAVEQHIAKLSSKLAQYRVAKEPKHKKKRGHPSDNEEDHEEYVKNEEEWGKGNEALANIFYDKPDVSSMPPMKDEVDDDADVFAETGYPPRKRIATGRFRQVEDDDDADQSFMLGDPNELLLRGTQYLSTNPDDDEDYDDPEMDSSMGNDLRSGYGRYDNQYTYSDEPDKLDDYSFYPGQNSSGIAPAFDPRLHTHPAGQMQSPQQNLLLRNQRRYGNNAGSTMHMPNVPQEGPMRANPLAIKMENSGGHTPWKQVIRNSVEPGFGSSESSRLPPSQMMNSLENWQGQPKMNNFNSWTYGTNDNGNAAFLQNPSMNPHISHSSRMRDHPGFEAMMNSSWLDSEEGQMQTDNSNLQDYSQTGLPARSENSTERQQLNYRSKSGRSPNNKEHPFLKSNKKRPSPTSNTGPAMMSGNQNLNDELGQTADDGKAIKYEDDPGTFNQFFNEHSEIFGNSD